MGGLHLTASPKISFVLPGNVFRHHRKNGSRRYRKMSSGVTHENVFGRDFCVFWYAREISSGATRYLLRENIFCVTRRYLLHGQEISFASSGVLGCASQFFFLPVNLRETAHTPATFSLIRRVILSLIRNFPLIRRRFSY